MCEPQLTEYREIGEFYRDASRRGWMMGGVMLTAAFAIMASSYYAFLNLPRDTPRCVAVAGVCVLGVLVLLLLAYIRLAFRRFGFYAKVRFRRLHELEEAMNLAHHLLIDYSDRYMNNREKRDKPEEFSQWEAVLKQHRLLNVKDEVSGYHGPVHKQRDVILCLLWIIWFFPLLAIVYYVTCA